MNGLIYPTYFPNITHVMAMMQSDHIIFEVCDNYQKQSFRNRAEIYGANGKLALTVPVSYSQNHRQLYKDVKIANNNNWQQLHLKSLYSAYSMSPFFEFYIDDFIPLFDATYRYILDLNIKCFELMIQTLEITLDTSVSQIFEKTPSDKTDYRPLVKRNFKSEILDSYTQVFSDKLGHLSNLSILDLLFNEGPNTELYLQRQILKANA